MRWPWPVALVTSVVTVVLVIAAVALAALEPDGSTLALALVGGCRRRRSARRSAWWSRAGCATTRSARCSCSSASASPSPPRARSASGPRRAPRHARAARLARRAAGGELDLARSPRSRCCSSTSRTAACRASALAVRAAVLIALGARRTTPTARSTRSRTQPPLEDLAAPVGPAARGDRAAWLPSPTLALLALLIASAASLLVRYRRADEPRRRQLKWLALAGVGVPASSWSASARC